jgi:hypothetical protein
MLAAMSTSTKTRNIVIASLVGSLLFAAGLGGFLWWYEGNEEDAARTATNELAAALNDNDDSQAPDGASDYVAGMRGYFGPIREAKTVDVRQVDNYSEATNSANDRSWWTSTIFLRSERGAALVLVTFADSFDPRDAKVEDIRELNPKKVAGGALTAEEMVDARRGFKARGGKAAKSLVLDGTFPDESDNPEEPAKPVPAPPSREDLDRRREEGRKRLKCVQDAQGDIEKLKKCSEM